MSRSQLRGSQGSLGPRRGGDGESERMLAQRLDFSPYSGGAAGGGPQGRAGPSGGPQHVEEEEYYDEEEPSYNTDERADDEYLDFLEEWGHVDFSLVAFRPTLRTVPEFKEFRKEEEGRSARMIRTYQLLESSGMIAAGSGPGGLRKPREETQEPPAREVKAERHEFTFADFFYRHQIQVDERGERLTSRSVEQGRVVSREGIIAAEPSQLEEEEWEEGPDGVQRRKGPPIIPVQDLANVYYFQYRIDSIGPIPEEGAEGEEPVVEEEVDLEHPHPRIIIGLCREDFQLRQDLSRVQELWALNLATGDKFGNRRWKDYYNLDAEAGPRLGHFGVGSSVGVLVDQDRGIVNFYKDGEDLGQAFVDSAIKRGGIYPFVQTQCHCELSVFHPSVYPAYRPRRPWQEQEGEGEGAEGQDSPPDGDPLLNDTLREGPSQRGGGGSIVEMSFEQ